MLRWSAGWTLVGWLCVICSLGGVDGLIEIVEEQRCHDYEFRLTCRDLQTHIAILEGWYTSVESYRMSKNPPKPQPLRIKTENDAELDRVYVYSSPKHDGVYVPANHSLTNVSDVGFSNETFLNESGWLNDTVDVSVEFLNDTEGCGVVTFARSYGSLREGDKRRNVLPARESSINLRSPLMYRCTGVNHCSFVLTEDLPSSMSWLPGVVYVKYACFDNSSSVYYCNREVQVGQAGVDSEGIARTPGYPHFYIGDQCRWKFLAHPEQTVQITLLDVSFRSIGPFETDCTDIIRIIDSNGETLMSSCEQIDLPKRINSISNSLEVIVDVKSKGAYPKRGMLLHYKSIGCVTLLPPPNGYLVYRNDDVAHYMCNVEHVFVDTRQRSRLLWCFDDNRWNDTVPLCVEEAAVVEAKDSSSEGEDNRKMPHNDANMIVDIVIPSLLIAALFIGNAFIVLIIYKYRKRKIDDNEDEFNTIPLSMNGNANTAGNAV